MAISYSGSSKVIKGIIQELENGGGGGGGITPVTTITSNSTDAQIPSAAAVWRLFVSIVNANEVSY